MAKYVVVIKTDGNYHEADIVNIIKEAMESCDVEATVNVAQVEFEREKG